MKTRYLILIVILCGITLTSYAQNVGINDDGSTPNTNSVLHIQSISKGLLVPRMTTAQRTTFGAGLGATDNAMLVYDTNLNAYYFWTGTLWKTFVSDIQSIIQDADADTKIQVEESADEDMIRFDLGGKEYFRMEGGRIEVRNTGGALFIGNSAGVNDDFSNNFNIGLGFRALEETTTGEYNVGIGREAMEGNTTGERNIAIGSYPMQGENTGNDNIALGNLTLNANTSGSNNIALGSLALNTNTEGSNNIALGIYSMQNSTTGTNNVAVGFAANRSNTTGTYGVAMGFSAGRNNTTGWENVSIGRHAMEGNTTGGRNIAIGSYTMQAVNTGDYNIALGYQALRNNTTGAENIGIGSSALSSSTGSDNVAIGRNAGTNSGSNGVYLGLGAGSNETGDNKLYIEASNSNTPLIYGDFANDSLKIYGSLSIGDAFTFPTLDGTNGQLLTTDGSGTLSWSSISTTLIQDADADTKIQVEESADEDLIRFDIGGTEYFRIEAGRIEVSNTGKSLFMGTNAGANDDFSDNYNVGLGFQAMNLTTTGANNVGIGRSAMQNNTSGGNNVAIGQSTLAGNTTGTNNIALGSYNMQGVNTGSNNVALGNLTLNSNTEGSNNIALGNLALNSNTEGSNNIALGIHAMQNSTTGTNNVAVGFAANRSNTTGTYGVAIGFSAGRNNTTGWENISIGRHAMEENTTGRSNIAIGSLTMRGLNTGNYNIGLGYLALRNNTTGSENVGIGSSALSSSTGSDNVAIGRNAGTNSGSNGVYLGQGAGSNETGDNKLYIEASSSSTPLIYGDFANDSLKIYGSLSIGDAFTFPTADGTNGQVLTTNGSGALSWAAATDLDEQTLNLSSNTLSITNGNSVDLSVLKDTLSFIEDADRDTKIQVEKSADEDMIRFEVAGTQAMILDSLCRLGIGVMPEANLHVNMGYEATSSISLSQEDTDGYSPGVIRGWQSITTVSDGVLEKIALKYIVTTLSAPDSLNLYEGEGTSGTLLGTASISSGTTSGWVEFSFPNKIILHAGQVYSIGSYLRGWLNTSTNPYADGRSSLNPVHDFAFRIYTFDSKGSFKVGDDGVTINEYSLPNTDGINGQVLTTDGSGNTSWISSVNDNLGNHTATSNIELNGNWLSNDGGSEGIYVATDGDVGIGTNTPSAPLEVATSSTTTEARLLTLTSQDGRGMSILQPNVLDNSDPFTFFTNNAFQFRIDGVNALLVEDNGDVGIRTTSPSYALQVGNSGDGTSARANSWNTFSDRRWKTNFSKIKEPLKKLNLINGYYYNWKKGEDKSLQVGVVAQEIEAVLPEIVSTDNKGYKSVDYSKISALLIEALKEQNALTMQEVNKVEVLEAKVKELELEVAKIKKMIEQK